MANSQEDAEIRNDLKGLNDLAEVPLEWNQGSCQVIVNRCANCRDHEHTTSHEEADFCLKFNEFGQKLRETFPNCQIIGNYDKPRMLGIFEAYIRGVGPIESLDQEGRLWLYQNYNKNESKQPKMSKIYDILCILCWLYGDSTELEKAQQLFLQRHRDEFSKKWKDAHGFPVSVPERKAAKKDPNKIDNGTQMICKHWGCGQPYVYDEMRQEECIYHPGRYEFGSMHGLWPELWTCCQKEWSAPGCKKGIHGGIPFANQRKLCINHGEINPDLERPDSACGHSFTKQTSSNCVYHEGYLKGSAKNAKWTCCKESGPNAPGCVTTEHKSATWPEEAAKLYFIAKEVVTHGADKNKPGNLFIRRAVTSGYFRKTKPYQPILDTDKMKYEEEKERENDLRYCLNWACEETYKEIDNKKKKNCQCHPGIWDFGHTGITVEQAFCELNGMAFDPEKMSVLWRAHWSCCRGEWNSPGCTKTFHKGPFLKGMPERKHKWPDEEIQRALHKKVSKLWKKNIIRQFLYDQNRVSEIFDLYAKSCGGVNNYDWVSRELTNSDVENFAHGDSQIGRQVKITFARAFGGSIVPFQICTDYEERN